MIDPAILFSGYIGGSSEGNITAVGIDALNNVVVAGWTSSNNLPASNGSQSKYGGSIDASVASFLPNGGGLNDCTYLGGSGDDRAFGLAIDSARNVYLTGWTSSTSALANIVVAGTTSSANFPVTAGAFQTTFDGQTDGFVARLSNSNGALLQSTFLGGALSNGINAMALDFHGNPHVTGFTSCQDFPVQRPLHNTNAGTMDAFVVKTNITLSSVTFGIYLGGSGSDGSPWTARPQSWSRDRQALGTLRQREVSRTICRTYYLPSQRKLDQPSR